MKIVLAVSPTGTEHGNGKEENEYCKSEAGGVGEPAGCSHSKARGSPALSSSSCQADGSSYVGAMSHGLPCERGTLHYYFTPLWLDRSTSIGFPGPPGMAVAMAEKKSIRVYEYGCGHGEIRNLDIAIEQMRRRIEFWNRLVEVDRDVRAKMDARLFAGKPETELASLRTELSALQRSGSLVVGTDGSATKDDRRKTVQIKGLRMAIRATFDEVKRIRKENVELHRAELRELDVGRKARIAAIQAEAGLYWANRNEIRRKYEFAREQAMRHGRQLQPQRWEETGRVRIHFQTGLAVEGAFLKNGRLQIDRVPQAAWESASRSARRHLARTRIRIRVAANDDRSPVWLDVPLVMHRPLPEGGVIRGVSFIRERVGLQWRHRVLITVAEARQDSRAPELAAALDVGWRLTEQGLRVAYWVGQDGRSGELLLPISDVSEFRRIGTLDAAITQAHRDTVALLGKFREKHPMPAALENAARTALDSSSPATLNQLVEEWRTGRFGGDRGIFSKMRAWNKQHIHLWTWQANLRDQLLRRRRELYRRFAADLTSRYGRIFVNDIRLGRLTVRSASANSLMPAQRHHRFIAALSVLYRVLQSACEKRGATFKFVRCPSATASCSSCGTKDDWDAKTELTHQCSKCGQSWDQDLNAAKNVLTKGLALGQEVPET